MPKKVFAIVAILLLDFVTVFSQPTFSVTDPGKLFKEAKDLFVKKQYALAYPLLKELKNNSPENTRSNHQQIDDDLNYYYIVCELKMQLPIAESEAKNYIFLVNNDPRRELMCFHLGEYYYWNDDYTNALEYFDKMLFQNLDEEEFADEKFEKGYCCFNEKKFDEALPLFDDVRQLPDNKNYAAANYYYGFISFYKQDYTGAMQAFKVIETQDEYKGIVPYYIAEILYFQKKNDEVKTYAGKILKQGNFYYEKELKQLLGQIYFEDKDYTSALPYLEYYVNNSSKISKEDLYELSYCYYQVNQYGKAIDGFKQLSNYKDSMGQSSMYLLADCYLQSGQKENARNAFQFCAGNSSNKTEQEISRFNYAKISYDLNYQDVALDETRKFLKDYPDSKYAPEAKEILVNLLANTNNFSDALEWYKSVPKPTPAMQKIYPRLLYGRAVELLNDQKLNDANGLLDQILVLPVSKVTPDAYFWKGEIAYRNANYNEAVKYLQSYLQNHAPAQGEANVVTAKYNLGYSLMKKEDYRQALTYFEALGKPTLASTSLLQDAYVRGGDCYFMLKEYAKANSIYEYIVNNNLQQSDYALYQKAIIVGIKNPSDKISYLSQLVRQYPQSNLTPDAYIEIADSYMADENYKDAIPYLGKILLNPDAQSQYPKAYLKLGLCYFNQDNLTAALSDYQVLLQKYPQSPEADESLDDVKNIYIRRGNPDGYFIFMKQVGKNISPSEADSITYKSASLKYINNDCSGAIDALNNYLSKYPNGANMLEANYFLGNCNEKNKNWKDALKAYNYVNTKGISKYFERATLAAAQINYFELQDYPAADSLFESLHSNALNDDMKMEALRGLVRCYYQLKAYSKASNIATELLSKKGISTDDRSVAWLVLGKSQQMNNDCSDAITSFKSCALINKSAWGAEARYELANCQLDQNNTAAAEKSALATIKETPSYEYWVTKSYLLLGDIFMQKKDYFNAKATYQSVAQHAMIDEIKNEANKKLENAVTAEKSASNISN